MADIVQALEPLYSEFGQTLTRGETIPIGQRLFIILTGNAVIVEQPPDGSASRVIRRIGPDDYVGDEALVAATCPLHLCALDNLRLLSLPAESLPDLFRISPEFALSLARKLREAIPLEDAATPGAPVPATTIEEEPDVSRPTPLRAAPAKVADVGGYTQPFTFNEDWFYADKIDCPACETRFTYLRVRIRAISASKRYSDFYYEYRSVNPTHYAIVVCPHCRFATFQDDFVQLRPEYLASVRADEAERKTIAIEGDPRGERDPAMVAHSLNLALSCHRGGGNEPRRAASLYHRLAWLARDTGDEDTERQYLTEALSEYRRAYETDRTISESESVNLCYMIGDLTLRLGDPTEAVSWFTMVVRMPESKKHREVLRLTRERWANAREQQGQKQGRSA